MKYIFDFDRTVFDMEALYREMVKTNPGIPTGTIESLEEIDLSKFLFQDALEFYAKHDKDSIEIVSSCYGKTGQWDLAYQTEKVQRSGVHNYVSAVHVVATDKIEAIEKIAAENTAIFVDDHPEHVSQVAKALSHVQVMYLDRMQEFAAEKSVLRIESLSELDAIIAT